MLRSWSYSLCLFAAYLSIFLYWKHFPSRVGFLVSGAVVTLWLAMGLFRARRRKYFVNRVDLCVHAYVIGDVLIESLLYEVLRRLGTADVSRTLLLEIHNNHNYLFCALVLASLVGGYRIFALRRLNGI